MPASVPQEPEFSFAENGKGREAFLGTLAHALRNPLGPIRTAAFLLKAKGAVDPEVEQLRGLIERQASQLAGLVDTLVDVTMAEQGRLAVRKEPLDLGPILAKGLDTWRPLLEAQGLQLKLDLPTHPLPLDGDPLRLEQVVGTLLGNACQYTPPGGQVWVEVRLEAAVVVLRVRDTGAGLSPGTLARLFTLFHQGEGSSAPGRRGLGVGLALARQFAALHGGSLKAASEGPGLGSEFTLRLPALGPAPFSPRAAPGMGSSQPLRVLVIDDDANDRLLQKLLLEEQGYEVCLAASGEAGLARALEQGPVIILVDLEMPGMGGLEAAKALRAALGAAPFLVAMTGHSHDDAIAQAMAAGFDAFLVKGADPSNLITLLQARLLQPAQRHAP